jgi:hypothetical protein
VRFYQRFSVEKPHLARQDRDARRRGGLSLRDRIENAFRLRRNERAERDDAVSQRA